MDMSRLGDSQPAIHQLTLPLLLHWIKNKFLVIILSHQKAKHFKFAKLF
jgi:hypothetical protein